MAILFLKFIRFLIFIGLILSSSLSIHAETIRTLVVLGDSISAGYGVSKDSQWTVLLQKEMDKNGDSIQIVNSSISGDTTGGGLSRLKKILNNESPDFVLIELGGNDALRGYPPKKIKSNLRSIADLSIKNGAEVILMQIRIPPNYGSRYVTAFESLYPELANEMDISYMDFMLEKVALESDLMLPDGIHPNEKAQPIIAEFIYDQITSLLD
jgi:acyl-CoA thioesterase-1|tara:strand:+ start:3726 stop:4361 length:636 start_codon:yes stop_codon:yes gene_type:complete